MISELAIVDPSAKLGRNVSVGPWSIIGADVELDDNVVVESHVVVKGPTKIASGVRIFQFATVGEDTPALAFKGEAAYLTVGESTVIREGVTIHRGMQSGGIGRTEVGANCLLMAYVHIGHDCIVGNNVIMANNASIAGHVTVGDHANFGGYAGVAQFRQVGAYSHIAAFSMVNKDIPAYMTVAGNPAVAIGMNLEGMKRRGLSRDVHTALTEAYRTVYRRKLTVAQALEQLAESRCSFPEVDLFATSVENSEVGIARHRSAKKTG